MPFDTAPFYAGSIIEDPRYFVGYKEQLETITNRAVSAQPTSINVVGRDRIGKSSLLFHFCQTYEERITSREQNPQNYLAIYLSLQRGDCQEKENFYKVVTAGLRKILKQRYDWFRKPRKLLQALEQDSFDTSNFYQAIAQFKEAGILPIICLDNIEALFQNPQEFDNSFYDNLRSLMDSNTLMLVIASEKNLQVYSEKKQLTSSFFNLGQVIVLSGLSDGEARDLVSLPKGKFPDAEAVLNEQEQKTALEWGGRNPYLLQLAGLYLWEAKQTSKDINWAKSEFDRHAKKISPHHSWKQRFALGLKFIFVELPKKLGSGIQSIGNHLDQLAAWAMGVGIIVIFIQFIFGLSSVQDFIDFINNALGLGK